MKHINKNSGALIVTVDFPAYPGSSGLSLGATVYNINTGLYMCTKDPNTGASLFTYPPPPALPTYAWTSVAPGTGSWSPGSGATGFEAYEAQLAELNWFAGTFGDERYWINLSAAHEILDRNDGSVIYASDAAALPNWDAALGLLTPQGPGFAGRQGYIIRIANISGATGLSMPTAPIYIHLTVDEIGYKDVNVIQWNGSAVSATTAGVPNVNVIEVMGNANAANGLMDFGVNGYDTVNSSVERVTNVAFINASGITSSSIANDAIHAGTIADNAIHADAIADDAIHAGTIADDAIHADAIADDAIHAGTIADDAIHADAIADDAIHAGTIADDAIHADAIADDAIHAGTIADDAIHADAIADDAIHADAIANNAIHADTIAGGAIHKGNSTSDTPAIAEGAIHVDNNGEGASLPAIEDSAIHATSIARDAIHADTIAGGAIHSGNATGLTPAIAEGAIHKDNNAQGASLPAIEADAIHSTALAENAINEEAIKIDSVTYEEISNSAIREIVSGVWNADIFKPIDVSVDGGGARNYSGSNYASATKGSVGHAMLLQYISQNVLHWDAADGALTSLHQCSHDNPAGTRFYSNSLPALSAEVAKGYIDKAAVVVKNWTIDSDVDGDEEFYLVRITGVGTDAHGNFLEIHMVDEDESPIPSGGLMSGADALLIKEETDSTMHEVAHEVWEESVFDHETPDTFGMFNRIMAGLTQFNHQITHSHYDETGRLLSCRLVVYPTSDDARSGTNALTTIEVSSSYDEKQNMITYVSAEEKKI